MPLARIITRLPQETAALAEYLRTQGYTVETVSSCDDDSSTPADLEISAEQYPFADAMARAREIAAHGWDIMVAPGVIDAAPQEREERARLLQLEAERESQRRAEHAAQIEAAAEQARIRELQRQMQVEAERATQAGPIHRKPVPVYMDSPSSSGNFAHQGARASGNRNKYSAHIRRRNPRQRDWEMAFAGAAAATVVLILSFGVLGARRPAVEQQLPFGAATIHPAASTAGPSTIPSQPVVAAKPPASQSAELAQRLAVGGTAPKLVATSATPTRKRRSALPNNDSNNDSDPEVVVRHFAPQRAPAKPAAKKSPDGVKRYSDIE